MPAHKQCELFLPLQVGHKIGQQQPGKVSWVLHENEIKVSASMRFNVQGGLAVWRLNKPLAKPNPKQPVDED